MLGTNIRKVRKEKKISINKLSEITGISLGYLSDLENNKATNPALEKLESIANALEIPLNKLLSTEEKLDMALGTIDKITTLAEEALNGFDSKNSIYGIASHFDNETFSKNEQDEIINFIKYVISKRNG